MENTLLDERYELLAEIGSGGEATVYRARDVVEKIDVAVRIPHGLTSRDTTETDSSPKHHENWVQLFDSGIDSKLGSYQVYELLEGKTLGQIVSARPLDAPAWRQFVDQSLAAVEALHEVGWIHGDLNADNFLQTTSTWKLLELPFLRFTPPANRSTLFGNIHTLSPEQFNGKQPDARSDLYSLGCLYYYAASGEYPHPGANSREVAIHCLRFAPEPLSEKAPALPAAWSAWVMQLIALKPADRFSSAAAARQLLGVA